MQLFRFGPGHGYSLVAAEHDIGVVVIDTVHGGIGPPAHVEIEVI